MKEIEVTQIRAVLRCRQCGEIQINDEHANTNLGDRALVMCNGECKTYNMHTVIAKRLLYKELGEVEEISKPSTGPIIVDPNVENPEGMADELIPEGNVNLVEEKRR